MMRKTTTPRIAKKLTMTRQSVRIGSAALRAMAQHVVGEDRRHHRFADRHGADTDAGIVAALGLYLDLLAVRVDAFFRQEDRARRLHRETHDDVLPGRDAAQNAAGIVREELDLAVLHAHLVRVLGAGESGGGEAGADLDRFHGVDTHHRAREIGIELAVDRIAPADGHTFGDDLDQRADRIAGFAHAVEEALPLLRHLAVGAPEGIILDCAPLPFRAIDLMRPHLHERAADADLVAEDFAADRAGGNTHRGLARRGAATAAIIADAVFGPIGVIGVAGTETVLDGLIIARALVFVLDQETDRRAGGLALEHAGQDLHLIGFLPLRREAILAGPALVEILLDVGLAQWNERRHAVHDAADRRSVALAPTRVAEDRAEAIAGHGGPLNDRDVRRVDRLHADDVIAAIDVMDLAGDARAQRAQQIKAGAADLFERDVALQRRVVLVPFEDVAEIADARRGERLDRAGRDRVDANALAAQIDGEIAHAGLERGLAHAHHVVMRHHALGAEIAQGHGAAAFGHQRGGAPHCVGEGEAGDIHAAEEIRACGVDVFALELARIGEGDRVNEEIEPAPALFQRRKGPVKARLVRHVAIEHDVAADGLGERLYALAEGIALIGEGKLRSLCMNGLRDRPGNRAVVGDAHNEATLARHQGLMFGHAPIAYESEPSRASYTEGGGAGRQGAETGAYSDSEIGFPIISQRVPL